MRIGSQLSGVDLATQHHLLQALSRLNESNVRLATMSRINRGSDDPAGLIAVEQMQAELTAINKASDNAARAAGMVHVADSALSEVSSLLNGIRGNVVAAAGGTLSDAELAANQLEVDAALEAINRIGSYTSLGGRKLLDGSSFTFNFSPDVTETVTLDMPDVNASLLGGEAGQLSDLASGSSASLAGGNLTQAIEILDAAQSEVLSARARAGAFEKYTIESTQRVLASMEVNVSSARSMIHDTDVALEASRRVHATILVDVATSTLAIADQRHRLIGGLLGRS